MFHPAKMSLTSCFADYTIPSGEISKIPLSSCSVESSVGRASRMPWFAPRALLGPGRHGAYLSDARDWRFDVPLRRCSCRCIPMASMILLTVPGQADYLPVSKQEMLSCRRPVSFANSCWLGPAPLRARIKSRAKDTRAYSKAGKRPREPAFGKGGKSCYSTSTASPASRQGQVGWALARLCGPRFSLCYPTLSSDSLSSLLAWSIGR